MRNQVYLVISLWPGQVLKTVTSSVAQIKPDTIVPHSRERPMRPKGGKVAPFIDYEFHNITGYPAEAADRR
jgi:hypothetical protein